jgi:hypothetical protein
MAYGSFCDQRINEIIGTSLEESEILLGSGRVAGRYECGFLLDEGIQGVLDDWGEIINDNVEDGCPIRSGKIALQSLE